MYLPSKSSIVLEIDKLNIQYSSSINIKKPKSVADVQDSLTAVIQKLKLFKAIPPNGLIIFTGNVRDESKDRDKRICIDIEPMSPVLRRIYFCSNHFNLDPLIDSIKEHESYGFIIMDGNGYLIAKLEGHHKK